MHRQRNTSLKWAYTSASLLFLLGMVVVAWSHRYVFLIPGAVGFLGFGGLAWSAFLAEQEQQVRTLHRKVLRSQGDGTVTEESIECNGTRHRKCVDDVTYAPDGTTVTFAVQISEDDLGPCNCT